MQTSAYFVAQAFFGQYGHQCKVNDHAYRKDDCGPGDTVGTFEKVFDQQFEGDTEGGNLHENAQGTRKDRERNESGKQRKEFCADREYYDDRQTQLPEPSGGRGQEADQKQIDRHRNTVSKQGNVDRRLTVKNGRKRKHKEADAASDHNQGPEGSIEDQKV